jgi:aldose 1-epimerase
MPRFIVDQAGFGNLSGGRPVEEYVLFDTATGTELGVTPFGAALTRLRVPDRNEDVGDVALGFDNAGRYEKDGSYQGVTVCPYPNRISYGEFELDGVTWKLDPNEDRAGFRNCLHSGKFGSTKKVWGVPEVHGSDGAASVKMTFTKPHEGRGKGFPGEVEATVEYVLNRDGMLIRYYAVSDRPTVFTGTNHTYFNLDRADGKTPINGHELRIDAGKVLEVHEDLTPTGAMPRVSGGLDFRRAKKIGSREIDTHYVFGLEGGEHEVELYSPESGRVMKIITPDPGVQFYTGDYLGPAEGFVKRSGTCLEPQRLPDAMNNEGFGPFMLVPGQAYQKDVLYLFSVRPG